MCENLATALFIKGLQGQETEGDAWDVLEYIRQRDMVHGPEVSLLLEYVSPLSDVHTAACLAANSGQPGVDTYTSNGAATVRLELKGVLL